MESTTGGGGIKAWGGQHGDFSSTGGSFYYTVASGDIDTGVVAIRLQANTASAVNKTLTASATNPLQFAVQNIGQ